jgi:signal transduction histidine kinase/ActR/RegA family two-component response regulator
MPIAFELLSAVVRYRADAIAIVVLTLAACGLCRAYLRRRGAAQEFSGTTCVWVIALVVVGALLAEWTLPSPGYPASAGPSSALMIRALVFGSAALVAAVGLIAAARIALLRAELRVHADAGRQLQQAKAAADDASRAKSDFLAVMSHEIRTPLNAVMGFAHLLAESKLEDAQRGFVNTITNEGARLGSLINDILDLTKIEKGRLHLERLPFAPAETAQEVLRLLSPRAADKKIDLRFEAHLAGPLLVAGDPLRFRQILVNLLDNAIKFTPRGSITLFMAWNPPVPNVPHGQLAIRVCDTGIGIPAEKLRDLFQMFMQADTSTSRRYGGTGLGLAISQRLVMLMGGEIVVRSTQGEGSEFSFTLSLPPFSLPEEPSAPAANPEFKPAQPPRILVVDDMETNRFLLEVFLRRHGFDPELAAGGEEAVRLALANHYDAILMDLQMPDIDGYTATKRIRSAEVSGRRTPIIALTASVARGTREKCLDAGMDEHLTKPLDLRKFKSLLNTFLLVSAADKPLVSAN